MWDLAAKSDRGGGSMNARKQIKLELTFLAATMFIAVISYQLGGHMESIQRRWFLSQFLVQCMDPPPNVRTQCSDMQNEGSQPTLIIKLCHEFHYRVIFFVEI